MRKIPTIFERDWNDDRSRVFDKPHPDCGWVFAGEGLPFRKYDGTCCLIEGGRLFKPCELRPNESIPADFLLAGKDDETGKIVGWLPVGDGPEDRWHREALALEGPEPQAGTYELCGPKVQGNPENCPNHILIRHATAQSFGGVPRDFNGLRDWLATQDIEGIVFHHPDGRMAKIKKRDFGLPRAPQKDKAIEKAESECVPSSSPHPHTREE